MYLSSSNHHCVGFAGRWAGMAGAVVLAALILVHAPGARAATLYWSSASGGSSWTDSKWATSSGGSYTQAWQSNYDAVFEGTAGTVTVPSGGVSVNSITFNVDGYTISGANTLTLTGTGSNVTTGSGSDTISAVIGGSAGSTSNSIMPLQMQVCLMDCTSVMTSIRHYITKAMAWGSASGFAQVLKMLKVERAETMSLRYGWQTSLLRFWLGLKARPAKN